MLNKKELSCIMINMISARLLLTLPVKLFKSAGNAAWINALYVGGLMFLLYFVTTKLYTKRKNVLEVAQLLGGRGLRTAVGIAVIIIFMINLNGIMRIYPESVKIVLLQNTRIEVIAIVFALTAALGALIGIKAIARIHSLALPFLGFVLLLFFVMLFRDYNVNNLLPVFGNGFMGIFVSGAKNLSAFSDILILNILIPFCDDMNMIKKSGYWALAVSVTIMIVICLAYGMVFPYPNSKSFLFAMYELTKIIHLSNFFSRLEAFFHFIWSFSILLYASVYIYVIAYVWQYTFGLKYQKPLILTITVVALSLSMYPSSIANIINIAAKVDIFVFAACILLPIVMGVWMKKKLE